MLAACAEQRVAVIAVRRRHQRRRRRRAASRACAAASRSTCAARRDRRGRPPLADRRAGRRPDGPEAEPARSAPRADARPLPAVVRVRDRRRLGRHALGRPGVDRLRAHRRARRRRARRHPSGRPRDAPVPASAAGPSLRELLVGSEGALGVISEATAEGAPRARRAPLEAWSFRCSPTAARRFGLEQADAAPDVSAPVRRGRDAPVAGDGSTGERAGAARAGYLGVRGHEDGCLAIIGWEGEEEDVERRRRAHGARCCAPAAASRSGRPGRGVAARPLRRALPARRAARPTA